MAAKKFLRRLLKNCTYVPRIFTDDKFASFGAAEHKCYPSVGSRQSRYLNNCTENSHELTRKRERVIQRFTSARDAQLCLTVFEPVRAFLSAPPLPEGADECREQAPRFQV
ncbi:MAG: DDE-type integrase/transposase/recombinase [Chloroflexota bacterium]|nr:DDE-type integrase/transposase/recombinase [Chloroflexota bacterium]